MEEESKMGITDIAGLGKMLPLDKLVDVISGAFGRATKSHFYKKDADAKAYEIEVLAKARANEMKILSEAVKENHQLTGGIEYKDEKIAIVSPQQLPQTVQTSELIEPPLENRIQQRVLFQEAKKQHNIENVAAFAAEELKQEETVTSEPLNEDWTTRFFKIAEDVSNEEMQSLWGKILAGEIKQPKSYSLRTLELIRNLTQQEADLFTRIANFAINSGDTHFIFKGEKESLAKDFNISFEDITQLVEIGLIQPGDFVIYQLFQLANDSATPFIVDKTVIIVKKKANTPQIDLPVHFFTKAGRELLKLIKINPPIEYLNKFANFILRDNVEVQYGQFIKRTPTHIHHANAKNFPITTQEK